MILLNFGTYINVCNQYTDHFEALSYAHMSKFPNLESYYYYFFYDHLLEKNTVIVLQSCFSQVYLTEPMFCQATHDCQNCLFTKLLPCHFRVLWIVLGISSNVMKILRTHWLSRRNGYKACKIWQIN